MSFGPPYCRCSPDESGQFYLHTIVIATDGPFTGRMRECETYAYSSCKRCGGTELSPEGEEWFVTWWVALCQAIVGIFDEHRLAILCGSWSAASVARDAMLEGKRHQALAIMAAALAKSKGLKLPDGDIESVTWSFERSR